MRAAVLDGVNRKIGIREVDAPVPASGECIVDVRFCALNHRDHWISVGQYAGLRFPIILGSDICGTFGNRSVVINPGNGWGSDRRFQSSSYEILGLPRDGGLAQKVAVTADRLYDKPEHLSEIEASALPLAGLTAFRALVTRAAVKSGEKVLITGIGGGVALFAMQFALALGAKVYVSSSSGDKIDKAVSMGASGGVSYLQGDWHKRLESDFGLMDVIIDGAGGPDFAKCIKVAAPGGRVAVYGATRGTWSELQVPAVFWKQLDILGSTMGSDEDFGRLLDLIVAHRIVPVVDRVFPIGEINEAMEHMASGRQFGKVVIDLTA